MTLLLYLSIIKWPVPLSSVSEEMGVELSFAVSPLHFSDIRSKITQSVEQNVCLRDTPIRKSFPV